MGKTEAEIPSLVAQMLAGDHVACGRLLSVVEELDERSDAVLGAIFDRLGRAYRVGLTGPPGAGKSSLCYHLARRFRDRDQKVGVVAVDPTSPLSGGAVLGDRIRLGDLAGDDGVFIRSLASRGSFGGLSLAAGRVADVLDAFGCDIILLETVGMGQVGDDIRQQASTTVVVLVPESGDGVQVMKAGILELADILVVNKSDRPGADDLLGQLKKLPERPATGWQPSVLGTSALLEEGLEELLKAIDDHRTFQEREGSPAAPDRRFWTRRFARLAERAILRDFQGELARSGHLAAGVEDVLAGRRSLRDLLSETVKEFYRNRGA